MTPTVDLTAVYALAEGLALVRRDASTVQIGTEPPRRCLLADAPHGAFEVLRALDGRVALGEAIRRSGAPTGAEIGAGDGCGTDRWRQIFADLIAAEFLVPAGRSDRDEPDLRGERLTVVHRYGAAAAERIMRSRSDAMVVVEGSGAPAALIADLLAAAGIGRVHLPPSPLRAEQRRGGVLPTEFGAPSPSSTVRPYAPAPQMHPTAVVLTGADALDPGRAAELVAAVVPHLAVRIGPGAATVGPLVLPGCSACLNCVTRHRIDADPHWPSVAAAARTGGAGAARVTVHLAAVAAAQQVLELIDGVNLPGTVGASVEHRVGSTLPRRRRWSMHPDCRCASLARR